MQTVLQQALTDLFLTLFAALLASLTGYVLHQVSNVRKQIGQRENDLIDNVVGQAVSYAEQSGLAEGLKKTGADKLTLALEYASDWLSRNGVKVSEDQLVKLIQSQVFSQFNYDRKPEIK